MYVIKVRNVNEALGTGIRALAYSGERHSSRNGDVIVIPEPVTTTYLQPRERVLFNRSRDANPFFHFYEALWMLAGSNDLTKLTPLVKRMAEFSDDGGMTAPGAYGHRWRHWRTGRASAKLDTIVTTSHDQLLWAIDRLNTNADDRRVVIQMYDPAIDHEAANKGSKDIPCNVSIALAVRAQRLDLTVFCRSNDAIWGAYGANAVQFSMLQEFIAHACGLGVGIMYQVSNNFHAYPATLSKVTTPWDVDPYADNTVAPYDLFKGTFHRKAATVLKEIETFILFPKSRSRWSVPAIRDVAVPMMESHAAYKQGRFTSALSWADDIKAEDWRLACKLWIERRRAAVNELKPKKKKKVNA